MALAMRGTVGLPGVLNPECSHGKYLSLKLFRCHSFIHWVQLKDKIKHRHTHRYTHSHTHRHAHTHVHARAHTQRYTHPHTHIHNAHTNRYANTHTHVYTTHTQTGTKTHTDTHTHKHTHTCIHTNKQTNTHTPLQCNNWVNETDGDFRRTSYHQNYISQKAVHKSCCPMKRGQCSAGTGPQTC